MSKSTYLNSSHDDLRMQNVSSHNFLKFAQEQPILQGLVGSWTSLEE